MQKLKRKMLHGVVISPTLSLGIAQKNLSGVRNNQQIDKNPLLFLSSCNQQTLFRNEDLGSLVDGFSFRDHLEKIEEFFDSELISFPARQQAILQTIQLPNNNSYALLECSKRILVGVIPNDLFFVKMDKDSTFDLVKELLINGQMRIENIDDRRFFLPNICLLDNYINKVAHIIAPALTKSRADQDQIEGQLLHIVLKNICANLIKKIRFFVGPQAPKNMSRCESIASKYVQLLSRIAIQGSFNFTNRIDEKIFKNLIIADDDYKKFPPAISNDFFKMRKLFSKYIKTDE